MLLIDVWHKKEQQGCLMHYISGISALKEQPQEAQ